MSEEHEREAANQSSSSLSVRAVKDPDMLARMVIREGKSFRRSALECGYSESIAVKGLANLVRVSSAFATAYRRESTQAATSLESLKPIAIKRLVAEIENPKSSLGIKAIELAGRFKETAWWVSNAEVQIGIFNSLAEPGLADDAIDVYDEKESSA